MMSLFFFFCLKNVNKGTCTPSSGVKTKYKNTRPADSIRAIFTKCPDLPPTVRIYPIYGNQFKNPYLPDQWYGRMVW